MSSLPAPLLEIANLTIDLPTGSDRRHAVKNVGLQLRRNEILCVVGQSGSGKSVMSRAVLRLFAPSELRVRSGTIVFDGEDLLAADQPRIRAVRGKRVGMVFQEPMSALNPLMTIGAQILEVLDVHADGPPAARQQRVLDILNAVNLPDAAKIYEAYPHQLSGGQRQRAMIAMALVLEPDVLIADEPTTALDVTTQAQILRLIRDIQRKRQMGVLFVTHDFGVVAEIADRIAVMHHGEIVEQGNAGEVLTAPKHRYTQSLLAAVPRLSAAGSDRAFDSEPTVLEVRGLEKTYRGSGLLSSRRGRIVHALKRTELSVRRGEIVGIVGESGSGKSTLAHCITRLVDGDSGEITLGGVDIAHLGQRKLRPVRRKMQIVFQDPYGSLDPRCTVGRLIAEGPVVHGIERSVAMARTYELLDLVGIDPHAADRYPHEFSGGQRQRIGLARALALNPDVLVLDEPVSSLDVLVQAQVLRLLQTVRSQLRVAMLFITHDLRVAGQICDRVAVMRRGEVVEFGPVSEVFARPEHPYTQELIGSVPGRTRDLFLARIVGETRGDSSAGRMPASVPRTS